MREIESAIGIAKYIIASPLEKHGGFNPQTIQMAKTALAALKTMKWMNEYFDGAVNDRTESIRQVQSKFQEFKEAL